MSSSRRPVRLFVVLATAALAGCTQSQAADLCAAISAGDVAAAEQALAGGQADMLRQQGLCHPAFDVLTSNDAAAETRYQIFRAMLKAGLDPNASLTRHSSSRRTGASGAQGGGTSATTRTLVEWAAPDRGAVEVLLAEGLEVKGAGAGRAVASAAGDGMLDVVTLLVEAGAPVDEPLLARDNTATAMTALGRAIAERHHDVITYLESKGGRASAGPPSPLFDAARRAMLPRFAPRSRPAMT